MQQSITAESYSSQNWMEVFPIPSMPRLWVCHWYQSFLHSQFLSDVHSRKICVVNVTTQKMGWLEVEPLENNNSYSIVQCSVCIYFVHVNFFRDLNFVSLFRFPLLYKTWSLLQFLFLWNLNLNASNLHPSGTVAPFILYCGFFGLYTGYFNNLSL